MNYNTNYRFLQKYSAELGSLASDFQVKGSCELALQTGTVQKASGGGKVIEVSFYDGKGQPFEMSGPNKGKSQTYTTRLIDAINADNTINIYISDTYETENGKKQISDKGEGTTSRKDRHNIDVRISGKEHNVINEKGKIMKQSAADILMHELVGHAIPRIAPSRIDTGNAIKNENIIRKELNVEERKEDEDHKQ